MVCWGREVCLFSNASVWDPRHNSYYYTILGCLFSATLREHITYLGRRTRLPLRPPTTLTREERIFADLWWESQNPRHGRHRIMHGSQRKCIGLLEQESQHSKILRVIRHSYGASASR